MDFLNIEIEHKLKQILNVLSLTQQSKKFMRVSKRKTLKSDDINNSLRLLNFNVIQLTQPVIGYDAYANLEYEKIENVNGLWRQKQIIVDIEDYISKPIVSCPMSIFPHFHWLVLEGKRPNITENFIKEPSSERFRIDNPIEAQQTIELNDDQIEDIGTPNMSNRRHYRLNSINTLNNFNQNSNENKPERHGVQQAIIHNISKELQIFLDNFELRFRKEIKFSSKPYSIRSVTKEMQISLNIIKSEPGVVELLPYIIEFLMRSMSNKQFLNEPKVLMIVIRTLQGILDSPYFNLDPYLHQIVTIVLSIILSYNDKFIFDVVIAIKEQAIKVMQVIFLRYEIKYPKFVSQLLNLLRSHIIPNKDLKLMTVYGAIKVIPIYPGFVLTRT